VGEFETLSGGIQAALQAEASLSNFIANGFSSMQSASVSNLTYVNAGGNVSIQYNVNIITDIDWITVTELLGVIGGVLTSIFGLLTGDPILVALGLLLSIGVLTIAAIQLIQQIIVVGGPFGLYLFLFAIIVVVGAGVYYYRKQATQSPG